MPTIADMLDDKTKSKLMYAARKERQQRIDEAARGNVEDILARTRAEVAAKLEAKKQEAARKEAARKERQDDMRYHPAGATA